MTRAGVEPLSALAVRLRELGVEVRVCAPPDRAERLVEVGVPLVALEPVIGIQHWFGIGLINELMQVIPAA